MTALSIQPTFPTFTGADGQPLENGYIWIGTANLNPITNPITVYWDAALSAPATQPIRTLGGYPSNSGTPARMYVNSDYSIQVLDRKGSVVYSAPVATERYGGGIINAADVVYDPAGTGSVATTAQAKLRQLATSPEDKGAYADGSTNDASYFQLAIDTISANGRGVLVLTPGKTYYLNSQINLCDNLVIWGYGAKLKVGTGFAGINKPLFKNFSGTLFSAPGTRLASQNIAFLGVEIDGQDTGVNGTTVADANMHGAIICCGGWDANTGVDNLIVRDCNMYSFAGAGVMTWYSSNVTINDNKFLNFFANTSLSIGSCIDHHDISNSVIIGNKISHTAAGLSWHGIVVLDWTTGSSNVVIDNNVITNMNGGDGISCEGNTADNLTNGVITNNIIKNCIGQGVGVDNCVSAIVSNNIIHTVGGPAILFTATGEIIANGNKINVAGLGGIVCRSGVVRASVANNIIQGITYDSANYRGHGIEIVDLTSSTTINTSITGNVIKDTGGCGIYSVCLNSAISGNTITNAGSSPSNTAVLRAGIVASYCSIVSGNYIGSIGNTCYGISSGSSAFPGVDGNRMNGTFVNAMYYIGYRSTFPIYHNFSIDIQNLVYDASLNVLTGKYAGVPAGYWYAVDSMYNTAPASAGYIGSVVVTTGTTWKTFGLIS